MIRIFNLPKFFLVVCSLLNSVYSSQMNETIVFTKDVYGKREKKLKKENIFKN